MSGCKSHSHCSSCRKDEAWRKSLLNLNLVNEINFPCPDGFTADNLPMKRQLLGGSTDHEKDAARSGRVSGCCSPPTEY